MNQFVYICGMIRPILFLLVFTLFTAEALAQNSWGLEGNLRTGFLAAHRSEMAHLPQNNIIGFEGSLFYTLKDTNTWAKNYNSPIIGVTLLASASGNQRVLGKVGGVYAFSKLPFFRIKNNLFYAKVGAGLGYASKKFDRDNNPENNAISTHLNVLINSGLGWQYQFGQNHLGFSAELTHLSNGALQVPNLGLNYCFLSLTYGRTFGESQIKKLSIDGFGKRTPFLWGISSVLGFKEMFPTNGKKYPVYGLNLVARKISSAKVGWELSLDGVYKSSIMDYLPQFEKKPQDIFQVGVFAGYILSFDRFSSILGMGVYLRDIYLPEDYLYHRVGVRYHVTKNIQTGLVLKASWGRADYLEWSLTYLLNTKKR